MEIVTLANLIDGELRTPAAGAYLEVFEPATGKVYACCPDSDTRDVEAAVAADPELSKLAAEHRSMAAGLRGAFGAVEAQPFPQRPQIGAH